MKDLGYILKEMTPQIIICLPDSIEP